MAHRLDVPYFKLRIQFRNLELRFTMSVGYSM